MTKKTDKATIKATLGDIEWRLDNLYHIKDKFGIKIKFVRNASQMRLWKDRWYFNLILKDRQRGFSTFIAILILDTCLFSENKECGIIDITLPDAKKKLEKIRFAYEHVPEWLKEGVPGLLKGIKLTTDAKEQLKWDNGSSVYVGTSLRGSTTQILHLSEMGKVSARNPERAREVRTGALNTVAPGAMIFNESTAEGADGDFFNDCQTAQRLKRSNALLTKLDYKFHFFGWWMGHDNELESDVQISNKDHEYFDGLEVELTENYGKKIEIGNSKRVWYVKKRDQQGEDMYREYPSTPDEAFKAAIKGAYLADIVAKLYTKGQIGIVPYDPSSPVNTGWDFGLSDSMTVWLHQRVAMQHRLIGYIEGVDEDILYYWRELQKLPYVWGKHFLPHDGGARRIGTAIDGTAPPRTIEQIFKAAGMSNTQIVPRIANKYTAIQEVKLWLPKCYINEIECDRGLKCLQNFRREWDENLGTWKNRPRHDWAMHGYDGLETLVRGLEVHGDLVTPKYAQKLPPPIDWRLA
jgi:hypothetical protein